MLIRAISAEWATEEDPARKKVYEGDFTEERIKELNDQHYNIYYLPNYPKIYNPGVIVDGSHIDTFEWVFVDMDLKDGAYTKDTFMEKIADFPLLPTKIVDSGNGTHVYWRVLDLDSLSYLKLQRRLCRHFNTDEAVSKIYQLMRLPWYVNPKHKDSPKMCEEILNTGKEYLCEDLDKVLPVLLKTDEQYCKDHYDKTYKINREDTKVDEKLPIKFCQLMRDNNEVKEIWSGGMSDRSAADYRLAHIMLAKGFTREEAMSVLFNCAKALTRAPVHRVGYAQGIVDKIWTLKQDEDKAFVLLGQPVRDLVSKGEETLKGTRFPCYSYLDNTENGFRLGQVIGLVAGAGVGKTAISLNAFLGFVEANPNYTHFFVSLEQPAREIALRWQALCGDNDTLHDKVEIIGNYNDDGTFRNLSLDKIEEYVHSYTKHTGKKVGCVAIDHIGVLDKNNKHGEKEGLIQICQKMKPFALKTNTMLMILSQAPREKAGAGDIELDKDASYGTALFEWYVDYLITLWQPLKRMYKEGALTVTAFKFCKIRHKNVEKDKIQEDVRYMLYFDPKTQRLNHMTQDQEIAFSHWNKRATNQRKEDKRTEVLPYVAVKLEG